MSEISISAEQLNAEKNDRFHRFKLISWWDQDLLRRSKVLVIGAGALGNEIIKNLALLGVGNIFIADMDLVENSNLSRSILYREVDSGKSKAQIAAKTAKDIYPAINAHYFVGNIVYDLGLGIYNWADVVIGGLDNREARLAINRACYKLNKPFIDGAIERIDGVARVFVPDGPCYECTMSNEDWKQLNMRRSCALLTRDEMLEGKVPTTPTISSVIAGIQVQEAVKYLHGKEVMAGKGFNYFGLTCESYLVEYSKKDNCMSHFTFENIELLDKSINQVTLREMLGIVIADLGLGTVIELNNDILTYLYCRKCDIQYPKYCSLGKVTQKEGNCPTCQGKLAVNTISTISVEENFLQYRLSDIGIPLFDIITARNCDKYKHYLFNCDSEIVLGI